MVNCFFKDIQESDCKWDGNLNDLVTHLVNEHKVLYYSSAGGNSVCLEMGLNVNEPGIRYVILDFDRNDRKIVVVFQEFFDEKSCIFKLNLMGVNGDRVMAKTQLGCKNSSISYFGEIHEINQFDIKRLQKCLQVHRVQMLKYCYQEDGEMKYRVSISLENVA